jgi:hypothetical protein
VIGQQPFSEAESEALRTAFEDCCQEVKFKSRTSYDRLLFQVVDLERQKLKKPFQEHDGMFNFTCDCWSDSEQQEFLGEFPGQHVCSPFALRPNTPTLLPMMANCLGIRIHWIDGNFCQHSTIFELEPILGDRTGGNLAEAFEKTLAKFAVWARIGHITTDEGSDMLLVVQILAQSIPRFTADNNGLRSLAHILNNAVNLMFTALHCEGFDNDEVALDRLNLKPSNAPQQDRADLPEEGPTQTLQVLPPGEEATDFAVMFDKVHRRCFGVRCSDKRRRRLKEKYRQCGVDFRVPQGDAVGCWNTLYDMPSRFCLSKHCCISYASMIHVLWFLARLPMSER